MTTPTPSEALAEVEQIVRILHDQGKPALADVVLNMRDALRAGQPSELGKRLASRNDENPPQKGST